MGAPSMPAEVARLFWEVDPATVDLHRHRDYVLERVMTRGGWAAMRWIRDTYSTEALREFLRSRGRSRLPPRELAYWSLIAGIEVEIPSGGGRPAWSGP